MGMRDKSNTFYFGGAFCEAKNKIWRRKSEGGAGIPFPLAPLPACPDRAKRETKTLQIGCGH